MVVDSDGKKPSGTVYTPFKRLVRNQTQQKVVRALVLKKWRFENRKTGQLWSFDQHSIDQEGTQMHARVGKDYIQLSEEKFEERNVYSIQRFSIAKPSAGYRIVSFENVMWLNRFTKVEHMKVDHSNFPQEIFSFIALENIGTRKNVTTYYTAVIERLSSLSNVVKKSVEEFKKVSDVLMREIMIENERGATMKVTLRGDLVHVIKDGMLESRVFVDLDVQQVRDFKTKLTSDPVEVSKVELKEDNPNKKMVTLFDLTEMLQYECNRDKTCYCEAIIVGMADGKDWYYVACSKCYKLIDGQDSSSKCGPDFREAIPWYILQLKVTDGSENVTFTVIGHNAEKMLKYTAEELR
ncbi:uncharacterized protein LOC113341224 [Papaver somniferum]|uniref:uncharacterized protein LOC113341224 n=1 Tax=Papaver somniferum TaxID=3469 RepID=UPI000E702310|nr:uncharacterized protein LOC113341224 [Papaver somniferum]